MSYCFNPRCPRPHNPETHRFCHGCGWRLWLGDRYEAVQPIGGGQNSRTFLGRDRHTLVMPQCLIKQFTPRGETRLDQLAAADRFRRDLAQLDTVGEHPQLPSLLGYFERQGHQFLIQTYVAGTSLAQRLQEKGGPFDPSEVKALLLDLLPLLHHLHQHQIVHRDIKPDNLRQPPGDRHWWLVDLGAAQSVIATRLAQAGTLTGSAEYAAPEQLQGQATYASDLYSLGVTCLHLLTDLSPFALFDGVNGCWRWRSLVPDLDEPLGEVLERLVQPAPRDRYKTAAEVMADLGQRPPDAVTQPVAAPVAQSPWQPETQMSLAMNLAAIAPLPPVDQLLLLTRDGTLQARRLSDWRQPAIAPDCAVPIRALAVAPDSHRVAIADRQGQLQLWQQAEGAWQLIARLQEPAGLTHQLMFWPDGHRLINALEDGSLQIWDWRRNQTTVWTGHGQPVQALSWNPTGTCLASGDGAGQIKLWQAETGDCLRTLTGHAGAISALAWLPHDAALVSAGWDLQLLWRRPETGGYQQTVTAAGFYLPPRSLLSHPTQPLVVVGTQDGQLQLWLLGQPRAIAQAKSAAAAWVALTWLFVTDTPRLLSAREDGVLATWTLPQKQ